MGVSDSQVSCFQGPETYICILQTSHERRDSAVAWVWKVTHKEDAAVTAQPEISLLSASWGKAGIQAGPEPLPQGSVSCQLTSCGQHSWILTLGSLLYCWASEESWSRGGTPDPGSVYKSGDGQLGDFSPISLSSATLIGIVSPQILYEIPNCPLIKCPWDGPGETPSLTVVTSEPAVSAQLPPGEAGVGRLSLS